MNSQKKMESLIWWHSQQNSTEIWSINGGFDSNSNDWTNTVLGKNALQLLSEISCHDTVKKLQEQAHQSCIRWQEERQTLQDSNAMHEEMCGEPVVQYKNRMQRLHSNIMWAQTLEQAAMHHMQTIMASRTI